MSELFAQKAVEVCEAISNSKTFDYISAADNYKWYLLMCNMPFFNDKLNWGGSIRGAWWDHDEEIILTNIGLWETEEQFTIDLKFTHAQWIEFIAAVINF